MQFPKESFHLFLEKKYSSFFSIEYEFFLNCWKLTNMTFGDFCYQDIQIWTIWIYPSANPLPRYNTDITQVLCFSSHVLWLLGLGLGNNVSQDLLVTNNHIRKPSEEKSTAGKLYATSLDLKLLPPPLPPIVTVGLAEVEEGLCHFGSRGVDIPVFLLNWEMSEAWWNLCTINWNLKWETEGSPFSTDKSEVDSNEKQGWCDPQHQTDWDICPVEENKRWRVGLFSAIERHYYIIPTFATLYLYNSILKCEI